MPETRWGVGARIPVGRTDRPGANRMGTGMGQNSGLTPTGYAMPVVPGGQLHPEHSFGVDPATGRFLAFNAQGQRVAMIPSAASDNPFGGNVGGWSDAQPSLPQYGKLAGSPFAATGDASFTGNPFGAPSVAGPPAPPMVTVPTFGPGGPGKAQSPAYTAGWGPHGPERIPLGG